MSNHRSDEIRGGGQETYSCSMAGGTMGNSMAPLAPHPTHNDTLTALVAFTNCNCQRVELLPVAQSIHQAQSGLSSSPFRSCSLLLIVNWSASYTKIVQQATTGQYNYMSVGAVL